MQGDPSGANFASRRGRSRGGPGRCRQKSCQNEEFARTRGAHNRRIPGSAGIENGLRKTIGRDGCHSANPRSRTIIAPAMQVARRSIGVVLIVALLGWTVNQPTSGCQCAHSRAAVVVRAGASPAHQTEPSLSRHNCYPPESKPAIFPPASAVHCASLGSVNPRCCAVSGKIPWNLPPGNAKCSTLAKFPLSPASPFGPLTPPQACRFLGQPAALYPPHSTSSAVLRL